MCRFQSPPLQESSSSLSEFVVSIQHRFEQESQMGVGDKMPCDKAPQASIVSAHVRMSLNFPEPLHRSTQTSRV